MFDSLFRLTWKKLLLTIVAWIFCVVMHNVVYALCRDFFGPDGDEPFFIFLAIVVIPLYFVVAVGYTVILRSMRE